MNKTLRSRGFTLVEMVTVMVALGVLAGVAWWGYAELTSESDSTRPVTQLTSVELVQRSAMLSRGSFVSSADAMKALEPSYNFVDSDQGASSGESNSVSVGAVVGDDDVVYAHIAAVSDSGVCFGLRVPDPRSGLDSVEVRRVLTDGEMCSAGSIGEWETEPW